MEREISDNTYMFLCDDYTSDNHGFTGFKNIHDVTKINAEWIKKFEKIRNRHTMYLYIRRQGSYWGWLWEDDVSVSDTRFFVVIDLDFEDYCRENGYNVSDHYLSTKSLVEPEIRDFKLKNILK